MTCDPSAHLRQIPISAQCRFKAINAARWLAGDGRHVAVSTRAIETMRQTGFPGYVSKY